MTCPGSETVLIWGILTRLIHECCIRRRSRTTRNSDAPENNIKLTAQINVRTTPTTVEIGPLIHSTRYRTKSLLRPRGEIAIVKWLRRGALAPDLEPVADPTAGQRNTKQSPRRSRRGLGPVLVSVARSTTSLQMEPVATSQAHLVPCKSTSPGGNSDNPRHQDHAFDPGNPAGPERQ